MRDEENKMLNESTNLNLKGRIRVVIDRPIGYCDSYGNTYPINYGYIPGIIAPDGEEQDAYVLGVNKPLKEFDGALIAIIHRKNDVEDKWVVSDGTLFSVEEIRRITYFIEQYFDSYIELVVN